MLLAIFVRVVEEQLRVSRRNQNRSDVNREDPGSAARQRGAESHHWGQSSALAMAMELCVGWGGHRMAETVVRGRRAS